MDSPGTDSDDYSVEEVDEELMLNPSGWRALRELESMLEDSILQHQLLDHFSSSSSVASLSETEKSTQRRRFCRTRSMMSCSSAKSIEWYLNGASRTASPRNDRTGDELSLWGVPLRPSENHEGTYIILLKFLRSSDFNPIEALERIRKTLRWRKEIGAEEISKEKFRLPGVENVVFYRGVDRHRRPVLYNVCSEFKDRKLHEKMVVDGRLLKWRIKMYEVGIQKLQFRSSGGVDSILQVVDLKDANVDGVKGLKACMRGIVNLLHENYPEIIHKTVFVNVSFKCFLQNTTLSWFLPSKAKGKFSFARPSKVTEKLLTLIAPEELPVRYGGLNRGDDDDELSGIDVSEVIIRPGGTEAIVIHVDEPGLTVVWDATVVGFEVSYKEEFIPYDEFFYKVLIHKDKKLEESVRNSFYINEPGKIVLTIDNKTLKKKKAFYRWKTKPTFPLSVRPYSILYGINAQL